MIANPAGSFGPAVKNSWIGVHASNLPGMLGLVACLLAVPAAVRRWTHDRVLWLAFGLTGLIALILASGRPFSLAYMGLFPLLGLLCLAAGQALLDLPAALRRLVIALMTVEFVSIAYVCLFAPFNISAGPRTVLTATVVLAHAVLVGALLIGAGAVRRGAVDRGGLRWTSDPDVELPGDASAR